MEAWFLIFLNQYHVATRSVEEDPALFLMHTTVSGGVPSDCIIRFPNLLDVPLLVLFIAYLLDTYLTNIVDHPCITEFNNSLDVGECIKWRTLRDELDTNQMLLNQPK